MGSAYHLGVFPLHWTLWRITLFPTTFKTIRTYFTTINNGYFQSFRQSWTIELQFDVYFNYSLLYNHALMVNSTTFSNDYLSIKKFLLCYIKYYFYNVRHLLSYQFCYRIFTLVTYIHAWKWRTLFLFYSYGCHCHTFNKPI